MREFCELAAIPAFKLAWEGEGVDTKGIDRKTGKTIMRVNSKLYRPAEVDLFIGDPTKASEKLGWLAKTQLPELVEMMVEADVRRARADQMLL